MIRFRRDVLPRTLARLASYQGRLIVLRSAKEVAAFIETVHADPVGWGL